jgi:phytoene desaturase
LAKKVIVIGSGFAGMSAASFMAKAGWQVTVVEKHEQPGGRARKLEAKGFTFDMGPSWYWMPDVFERYFSCFGKKVSDYYQLKRLDPSYRIYWNDGFTDVPANYNSLQQLFEQIEPGSAKQLDAFLDEAAYKYKVGINKLVHKPGLSVTEFLDADLLKGLIRLDVFTSMKKHVAKYFKNKKLQQLMEFPVLFLGALPEKIPALYSLMNYADIKGGTWFPEKGMYSIVEAMYKVATELGVKFVFNTNVEQIVVNSNAVATGLIANNGKDIFEADVIINAADYHFTETKLLPPAYQSYSNAYWESRVMAPGCLLYYVGINKKLSNIPHHTLFFDTSFEVHGKEIYTTKVWPSNPLFYVSATSVTDATTAPANCENLFFLIPTAVGLENDTEALRDKYFNLIVDRFEQQVGEAIKEHIVYKKSFAHSNFIADYNAFKGNAYGLANTLLQTSILKPQCISKKVKNLFHTGQLTVPGPGVPPSLISGEVVSKEVLKRF